MMTYSFCFLPAQGRGGHDPFDIFSSFFGGGGGGGRRGGRNQKQQFPALHIELPITLKDIYNGRTFRVTVFFFFVFEN